MFFLKSLAVVALIGSVAWVAADPGFEPALAIVGSLSALVSMIFVEKRKAHSVQQHQKVSKSSIGIQAGGDVQIGNGRKNTDAE